MSATDPDAWTCPRCLATTRNTDPAVLAEVQRVHRRRHRLPRH